jgi:hypothetical protein
MIERELRIQIKTSDDGRYCDDECSGHSYLPSNCLYFYAGNRLTTDLDRVNGRWKRCVACFEHATDPVAPEMNAEEPEITTEFNLGDKITVKAVDVTGFIDQIQISLDIGTQYRVVHWLDGKRYEMWMYDRELEACDGLRLKKRGHQCTY